MKRQRWWQSYEVVMGLIIFLISLPNFIVPILYIKTQSLEDLVKVFTYPFLVALGFYVLTIVANRRTENKLISSLAFEATLEKVVRPYYLRNISCIGTKYEVEGGPEYWNGLAANAKERFVLVSKTNKSWFDKGDDQSRQLARVFVRLVAGGGSVVIISQDDPTTIEMTMRFVRRFLRPEIEAYPSRERERLISAFAAGFSYRTFDDSNYSIVVSDGMIVFMPVFNTAKNREEAPWLEIIRTIHKREYQNFISDIERMIEHESQPINLDGVLKSAAGI